MVVVGGVAHCNSAFCMDANSRDPATLDAVALDTGTALGHISVPGSYVGWAPDGNSLLAVGVNNADMLLWKCNSDISSE